MSVKHLDFAEPFFQVSLIENEDRYSLAGKAIVLNLSDQPVKIEQQTLGHLQSAIFCDTDFIHLGRAVVVQGFDRFASDNELFAQIKTVWPSAFEVRGEERLRGISHYMSKKIWIGQLGLTMYHSGSVPLNVGLHKDHAFCPVPGFKEVHTQIAGFGKMQQCRKRDINTLYLEEPMAPGTTHRPMYDEEGNYPWHQFETITPSVFMAVEMLPDGASPPEIGERI